MFEPLIPYEGQRYVVIDCPNCGERENIRAEEEQVEKCMRCGYNGCEVLNNEVYRDGEWVNFEE